MPDIQEMVERNKLVRRLVVGWAVLLITFVVVRVTAPEVITVIGVAGATVVTGVIGLFGTVLGLYQHHRHQDDQTQGHLPRDHWPPRPTRAGWDRQHEEEHW